MNLRTCGPCRAAGIFLLSLFIFRSPSLANETTEEQLAQQVAYKTQVRDTLKSDLVQIQSEQQRCKKAKSNWTAATIVGGVGVVGTGIGAIVQANKISDKKKTLSGKESELGELE